MSERDSKTSSEVSLSSIPKKALIESGASRKKYVSLTKSISRMMRLSVCPMVPPRELNVAREVSPEARP